MFQCFGSKFRFSLPIPLLNLSAEALNSETPTLEIKSIHDAGKSIILKEKKILCSIDDFQFKIWDLEETRHFPSIKEEMNVGFSGLINVEMLSLHKLR